ncbi:hypothetical protein BC828DRAFT_398482 [Blastocladiella britannica]|nr:hypothetical protein BC828DRAFT_398482 [Blastocladiella britannica]
MGCGASKEAALSVHPSTAVSTTTSGAVVLVPVTSEPAAISSGSGAGSEPLFHHHDGAQKPTEAAAAAPAVTHAPQPPSSASTLKTAMLRNDRSVPSSASTTAPHYALDLTQRSDSGMGTRHSAGSSKSATYLGNGVGGAPSLLLPSIPVLGVVATNGGSGMDGAAVEASSSTAFEIPLDETVKVRARKPTSSAAPRNRRRTLLQPMAQMSTDEALRKLRDAESRWEEDPNAMVTKDKDLSPAVLRAVMADREQRAGVNRQRELEEKKLKLAAHDAHARTVAERKQRLVAASLSRPGTALGGGDGNDAMDAAADGDFGGDAVPTIKLSWGGSSSPAKAQPMMMTARPLTLSTSPIKPLGPLRTMVATHAGGAAAAAASAVGRDR